jgi:hypothetical protein
VSLVVPQSLNDDLYNYLYSLKKKLEEVRYIYINGDDYRNLLLHIGASIMDLDEIESGRIHDKVDMDVQPTMPFRQVAHHRVLFDVKQEPLVREANYPGITQINPEEIISDVFKRYGTRTWSLPPK